MSEDWIMTQSGAVCKSEVALIVPQNSADGKRKDIMIITKNGIQLPLYTGIENLTTANMIIDNVLMAFDDTHVPQVDLQKQQLIEAERAREREQQIRAMQQEQAKAQAQQQKVAKTQKKKPQPEPEPEPEELEETEETAPFDEDAAE